ncbi:MAG: crotonase/enoyl-CoA hydratase family protein [Gammaproteobacteria bacterium]
MLIKIDTPHKLLRHDDPFADAASFPNLELRFERHTGILWKYIAPQATPHFSHELLDDIRRVQDRIRSHEWGGQASDTPVKYVVFASRIPGVYSLGGDLRLFRRLIAARNRAELMRYARKATDAVYHHASNTGHTMSFSLVRGVAMGGGFEAALAGNVLVAEEGSRMGFPEVLFGLFPGMGAYTFLRRRVDAMTAEKIILSARNYRAEELHEMGVVDVLCPAGEGEATIRSHVSRQASRPGAIAFRQAIGRCRAVDRDELYSICDAWVETALELPADCLRRIDRLIANQDRNFAAPHVAVSAAPTAARVPLANAG